jgi:hypothetical protein
VCIDLR